MIELPKQVTAQVPEPNASKAVTNGDLLELFFDYQMSLRMCNGKLEALEKAYGEH